MTRDTWYGPGPKPAFTANTECSNTTMLDGTTQVGLLMVFTKVAVR